MFYPFYSPGSGTHYIWPTADLSGSGDQASQGVS